MAIACLDSSILLEHYRKKDKSQTRFAQLALDFDTFVVPTIVEYEIMRGEKDPDNPFWANLFDKMLIVPFDRACVRHASEIYAHLKGINQHQQPLDILIAATARACDYRLATLNTKHFEHIPGLRLV